MVFRIIVVMVFALSLVIPAMAQEGDDTDGLNAALAAYFEVSVVEVDAVRDTGISDDDIVNLVNLKFISSHYDYSAFDIMAMRDNGFSYAEISTKVSAAKEQMINYQKKKEREAAKKEADG